MKKSLLIFICATLLVMTGYAQNDGETFEQYKQRMQKEMADFKNQKQKELDDFRKKANEEFAAFMKQKWEELQAFKGVNPPEEPKPPVPTPVEPDRQPSEDPIPFHKIEPKPAIPELPQPILPDVLPVLPPIASPVQFNFYNTLCSVKMHPEMKVNMNEINEEEASRVWSLLSNEKFDPTIKNLLDIKTELLLNDWGYIQLVRSFSEAVHGTTLDNAALLQAYILSQSGVDLRLVFAGKHLYVAVPFDEEIYRMQYIQVGDLPYYMLDRADAEKYFVFNRTFPGCKTPSIRISNTPAFEESSTDSRVLSSVRYPEIRIRLKENKNLIDYYNNYPLTSKWNYYSQASLSDETKEQLYPILRSKIKGLTEGEAANVLINFVQTAFEYATDQDQFGYERPLFGDETFYYPFSDCEDRSILYSILVQDLLGLDVVLLHFPGHLATAVEFTTNIKGDYLLIDDVKYVVCDPTYIGATIGMAMPEYKKEGTEIEVIYISF